MPDISVVYPSDRAGVAAVRALLAKEGLRLDPRLDYTCAVYDEHRAVIATGSCAGNTLRCIAVDASRQGEGLLNALLTHLLDVQQARGNSPVFLYTKCASARFFGDLGFYEIARVPDHVVFMENTRWGFSDYLKKLQAETPAGDARRVAAIVMNANPFTLGHAYLAERAAQENDRVHLFIVSEDASFFPHDVRVRLVREGTAHLPNVVLHESSSYIVSQATFPSYFQKDEDDAIRGHAQLDLTVFTKIAAALRITRRYVGAERASRVTRLYNATMRTLLPQAGIACEIIPRKEYAGMPISASTVRSRIKDGNLSALAALVPPATLAYLRSEESAPVRRAIAQSEDVAHY